MKFNYLFIAIIFALFFYSCNNNEPKQAKDEKSSAEEYEFTYNDNAIINLFELGSSTCVPCKQMKSVLEAIDKKYGEQINIIFIDVNKEKNAANDFGIRLIPTQIFQDNEGNELHRHEGFYPEEEIDKVLKEYGLEIVSDRE